MDNRLTVEMNEAVKHFVLTDEENRVVAIIKASETDITDKVLLAVEDDVIGNSAKLISSTFLPLGQELSFNVEYLTEDQDEESREFYLVQTAIY